MYNIKIKSVPNKAKTGSQLDYSLVDRNTLFLKPDTQVQSDVKNTISAVPREHANIEAEGGETIIGDTNNDGFLEHQTIVGNKHTKGGVPLKVPEGSFIFSDTDKLRIKDPEIFKLFGMAESKKGYTPAEIAKKYQVNDYMAILKDDTKDKYSKETAQIMLDSNLKKLGMLALVQESMKGFPDGIPAIAESVMAGLQQQQAPGQEEGEGVAHEVMEGKEEPGEQENEMRYGGMAKYQKAGTVTFGQALGKTQSPTQTSPVVTNNDPTLTSSGNPKQGFTLYKGTIPVYTKPLEHVDALIDMPGAPYIQLTDGTNLTKKEFDTLMTKGALKTNRRGISDVYSTRPLVNKAVVKDSNGNPIKSLELYSGDKFYFNNKNYTVINPAAELSSEYLGSGKMWRDMFDNTNGIIHVKDKNGNEEFIESEDLGNAYSFDKDYVVVTPNPVNRAFYQNMQDPKYRSTHLGLRKNNTTNTATKTYSGKDVDSSGLETDKEKPVGKSTPVGTPANVKVVKKPIVNTQTTMPELPVTTTSEEFEFGGLTHYQTAGTVNPPGKTIVSRVVSSVTGNTKVTYSDGSTEIIPASVSYDVADEDLRKNVGDKGYSFNELDPQYRYQHKAVGPQGRTTGYVVDPESGFYYHPDPKVGAPKPGTSGLANYMNIHKEAIDAYPGGADAWKKTMIEAGGKENPAMSHLLEYENTAIGPIANGKQYIDLNKRGARIPGVENFNLPGISKKQAPAVVNNTPATTSVNVEQKTITPSVTNKTRGWFTPDMLNLANAFGSRIGKFPPTLEQVRLQTGPYNLQSPAAQIASMQSSANTLANQAMNTMDANTAFAASLGAKGQYDDKIAGTIGQYGNANVTTSNEASRFASGVFGQQELTNAQLRSAFDRDNAIYGQNLINSLNKKDLAMTRAFNKGWDNSFKANMLEDIYPQVGIDRIHGDIGWSGQGRNPFGYDNYINPLTAAAITKGRKGANDYEYDDEDWKLYNAHMNDGMQNGMTKEQAHTFAIKNMMAKKSNYNNYDNSYNPAYGMSKGLSDMFES